MSGESNLFKLFIGLVLSIAVNAVHAVPITLDAAGTSFGAELLTGTSNTGVIFFHGRSQNPNGDVVRQLQASLNGSGYTTLSLEDPVPAGGTSFGSYASEEDVIDNQVFARLNAALVEMSTQGVERVVLSGFSLGSRFMTAGAAAWDLGLFTPTVNIELAGLVGVGMSSSLAGSAPTLALPQTLDDFNVLDTLTNLSFIDSIPVLDLFGSNDTVNVVTAGLRSSQYAGDPAMYVQSSLQCPPNDGSYYARVNGVFVPYYGVDGTQINRCHQLRNGWLPDGNGGYTEDFIVRAYNTAPLEMAVSDFFNNYIEPRSVPEPGVLLFLLSGLMMLLVFRPASRKF